MDAGTVLLVDDGGKRFNHLERALRIQAGGRFDGQHHTREMDQRAGDRATRCMLAPES